MLHRPPGPYGRPRPVLAGLGDHGRRRTLGRHRAAGERGDGRRRHLGHRGVRDARRLEELYLPDRGRGRRGRGGAAGGGQVRRPPVPARAAGLWPNGRRRPPASTVSPARPEDRLAHRIHRSGARQAARGRLQPRRAGPDRRHGVLPVRRAPRRRAARPPRDHPGPAERRDLPGYRGWRGLDPAAAPASGPRRPEDLQAPGHPRAPHITGHIGITGRPAGRRARAPRPADAAAGAAHLPADRLPRVRRGRLPGVQLPRRGHEHRPVPEPAGRLPARPGPAGQGDRARPAPGLLRQRHPPERDPGRRRSRRGVLAEHQRHRRRGARDPDQHRPAHRGGHGRERRGRRPDAGAGRRPGAGAGPARSSIRTTA